MRLWAHLAAIHHFALPGYHQDEGSEFVALFRHTMLVASSCGWQQCAVGWNQVDRVCPARYGIWQLFMRRKRGGGKVSEE